MKYIDIDGIAKLPFLAKLVYWASCNLGEYIDYKSDMKPDSVRYKMLYYLVEKLLWWSIWLYRKSS